MSETITRYHTLTDQYGVNLYVEADNGKWVKYEDVEQIVSELEYCQDSYIKVGYWVENGGDGSASPVFTTSEAEAESAEEASFEEGYDCFAEPSSGTLRIYIRDGKFYLREVEHVFDDSGKACRLVETKYHYHELEVQS